MTDTVLRHALELMLLIPASIFCFLPIRQHLKFNSVSLYVIAFVTEMSYIAAAAFICYRYPALSPYILYMAMLVFFPLYLCVSDYTWPKLLFCFATASMLCTFCVMYTNYLTAPHELDSIITFSPRSSLICLGLAGLTLLVYSHVLTVQLPYLFSIPRLDNVWIWLSLVDLLLALLFHWLIPSNLSYVLVGRTQALALVTYPLFPLTILLVCWLCYRLACRLNEAAALAQENDLLRMETRRYEEFDRLWEENRILRHDFRQHINVIAELAHSGRQEELLEYLGPLEAKAGQAPVRYSLNPAVDAVAAHYARQAEIRGAEFDCTIDLPRQLPLPDAEFCAMLGNLLDNSVNAVTALPPEQRRITVTCRMLSQKMLGLSVENPYSGKLSFGPNGLPAAKRKDHGIGLSSVAATVHRYHGTVTITGDDGIFAVNLLLNF